MADGVSCMAGRYGKRLTEAALVSCRLVAYRRPTEGRNVHLHCPTHPKDEQCP